MNYYLDAVTGQVSNILADVAWMQEDEKILYAISGLEGKLDGIKTAIQASGQKIVNQLSAMKFVSVEAEPDSKEKNGWDILKGAVQGSVTMSGIFSLFGGSSISGTALAAITEFLFPAIGLTAVIAAGVDWFSTFMEKVTGNEPTPVPSIRANPKPEPTYKESFQETFTPKIRHISDWETSLTRQMNTFIQYSSDVDNRQNFVDSSTSLGQQTAMVQQQTGGDTIYQITMNNSFAVDREETADYCIGELYRRMRAELDGTRLGVAY